MQARRDDDAACGHRGQSRSAGIADYRFVKVLGAGSRGVPLYMPPARRVEFLHSG